MLIMSVNHSLEASPSSRTWRAWLAAFSAIQEQVAAGGSVQIQVDGGVKAHNIAMSRWGSPIAWSVQGCSTTERMLRTASQRFIKRSTEGPFHRILVVSLLIPSRSIQHGASLLKTTSNSSRIWGTT